MSGRTSRTKGHAFERKISQEMRDLGFRDCVTVRESRLGNWSRTDDGRDIVGTPGFAIQVKNRRDYCSVSTIEEIVVYPKENEKRIVIAKANHKEVMAIIPWEDLKLLIKVYRDKI